MPRGTDLIAEERNRQISEEGYSEEHDSGHHDELIMASMAYSQLAFVQTDFPDTPLAWYAHPSDLDLWPWHRDDWKPSEDPKRNLTKAGALIAAAIDSLDKEQE